MHLQVGVSQRHSGWLEAWEALLLPTIGIEALTEVTLAVEKTDADKRNAEIRRCLQVIAGEHAKAAAVLRHRFADAELWGEVSHQVQGRGSLGLEPARRRQDGIESNHGIGDGGDHVGVGCEFGPFRRGDSGDHRQWLMVGLFPRHRMQPREQLLQLAIPAPVQIVRQTVQPGEHLGNDGVDPELTNAAHGL